MPILIRLALIVLSSILASLAFPPVGLWWLVLIAWVPLFVAIKGMNARPAFYMGLLQGMILYGITLSWLWNIFGATAIILWFIIAFFVGISCALTVSLRCNNVAKSLLAASVWVGAEFFRSEIYMLHFPWITPGVGMQPSWISPLVGVYGVSFIIIFCAVLIAENQRSKYISFCILGIILASGIFRFSPQAGDIPVICVQTETGVHYGNLELSRNALAESKGHAERQGFILWSEKSIDARAMDTSYIKRDLLELTSSHDHVFVFGTSTDSGTKDKNGGSLDYNSAITLHKTDTLGMHHKNRPVPLFNDGVAHHEAKSVKTPLGTIGTPICFDCDHEAIIRRMVADGAEILIVPSLDAISWSARQHRQHAELFRHRAAENNRWIAVAASSGLTQIIDPHGNRIDSIPLMDEGYLIGNVSLTEGRTIYNRLGWLTGWLCMGVAAILLFINAFKRIRNLLSKN